MAENLQKTEIKGRDISRPVDSMELDGVTYPLAFDTNAMRVAEDVYDLQYHRNDSFLVIMQHLAAGRIGAIMAVLYGALNSGGLEISWEEFTNKFKLTDIPGFKDMLMANVRKALPEADKKKQAGPTTAPTAAAGSPG